MHLSTWIEIDWNTIGLDTQWFIQCCSLEVHKRIKFYLQILFILNCQTSLQFVHHAYWAKHPEVLIFLWRLSLDDVGELRFVWKLALRACFVQSEIKTSIPSYFVPKLKCNLFTNNKNTVTIKFQTIQFPKTFEWLSIKWMVTFSFFQKINSVFLIKI